MANVISGKLRKSIEMYIYQAFDKIDKTKSNSDHYKKIFNSMNDTEFTNFLKLPFPFRFHHKPWEVEPNMNDIKDGLNFLKVPLMEKVALPYLCKNDNGEPIMSQPAIVLYAPEKCMQQLITKKNKIAIDIDNRDMKTGLLNSDDKGGKSSDREIESLGILGLDNTMKEFTTAKADSMESKTLMNNSIMTNGQVSLTDIQTDNIDSLSKNLLSVYLLGAHIMSNIVNEDYMTPYTLKNKNKNIQRI